MQLTLGDLILIELALANFLKGIDLSMQAGQQMATIIGKLEYQIGQLQQAMAAQAPVGLQPPKADPTS